MRANVTQSVGNLASWQQKEGKQKQKELNTHFAGKDEENCLQNSALR
jgi:hypothetical protein